MTKIKTALLALSLCAASCSTVDIGSRPAQSRQGLTLEQKLIGGGFFPEKIEFPELKVTIPSTPGVYFKEAIVDNVGEAVNNSVAYFGAAGDTSAYGALGWAGKIYTPSQSVQVHLTVIKKGLEHWSQIFTQGHEHGHVIWNLNKTGLIYNQFENPKIVQLEANTTEEFAHLCGWMALSNTGIPLDQFNPSSADTNSLAEAYQMRELFLRYNPQNR